MLHLTPVHSTSHTQLVSLVQLPWVSEMWLRSRDNKYGHMDTTDLVLFLRKSHTLEVDNYTVILVNQNPYKYRHKDLLFTLRKYTLKIF